MHLVAASIAADRHHSLAAGGGLSFIRTANHMRTIAIVEDDPSMLKSLTRLLATHGFRVLTFTSAESFLADAAGCQAKCLLVDIHLGGISGIEMKRRLTSSGSDFLVIFMTAIDSKTSRREAFEAGCVAYLRKPFMSKLLIDAIESLP